MPIEILCLGGTSIDLIQDPQTKAQRSSKKRPKFKPFSVGGSVTNTAIICAKLGLKTAMLSRIGKDNLGNFAVKFLRSQKVNISGIIQDPKIQTPRAVASLDQSGNAKYTFYKNHPRDSVVPLKGVPKKLLNGVKVLHFGSSFSHQLETFQESLKYITRLKKQGVFISLDPNLRPYSIYDEEATRQRIFSLLRLVDLAKLSLQDIRFLTGKKEPKIALKKAHDSWPNCQFILTLGKQGSMGLYGENDFIKVPIFKVKTKDTIGAGDAFTAGLLFRYLKAGEKALKEDLKNTLKFASIVSALVCTESGASKGLKSLSQVKKLIKQRRSII
ncbi:MAG: carbohydrate kinase [Candidatus Omnitrophota bacterium]